MGRWSTKRTSSPTWPTRRFRTTPTKPSTASSLSDRHVNSCPGRAIRSIGPLQYAVSFTCSRLLLRGGRLAAPADVGVRVDEVDRQQVLAGGVVERQLGASGHLRGVDHRDGV